MCGQLEKYRARVAVRGLGGSQDTTIINTLEPTNVRSTGMYPQTSVPPGFCETNCTPPALPIDPPRPGAPPTVDRVRRLVEGAPSRRPGRRAAAREVGPDDEASFLSLVAESVDILVIFAGGEERTMCAVMPSWGPKVASTPVVKAITVP